MSRKYSESIDRKIIKYGMVLYLIGVFFGAILAHIFKDFFLNNVEIFRESFNHKLMTLDIDCGVLFGYVMWSNTKQFLWLFLFSVTSLGVPYIICKISYSGFTTGLLLSTAIFHYNAKGVLLFVLYIFPQGILYIPVWYLLYLQSYHLNESLLQNPINYRKNRMKIIMERLPSFLLLFIILFIAGLLEVYINSPIVQWGLNIFS